MKNFGVFLNCMNINVALEKEEFIITHKRISRKQFLTA